ncbi:MAG: GxxExxY protein [Candidatus Cloacimonadales bacterium]
MEDNLHFELTDKIINAFYEVYNTLGYGFLEKVYEKALLDELTERGFTCLEQQKIDVFYKNKIVGEYYADLIINDAVILELKASDKLIKDNECQLLNYLKATKYEIGLLLNFGKKPEIKRKIFTNNYK